MARLLVPLLGLLLSTPVLGQELVQLVSFAQAKQSGALLAGVLTDGDELTLVAVSDKPFQAILELKDPNISSAIYALQGSIRYADVGGVGYLQLDNQLGDRGTFFTKALAPDGPMGKISGNSNWRPFVLPFNASSDDQADAVPIRPNKLTLGIYLPDSGTVNLRDVRLVQFGAAGDQPTAAGQWFSDQTAIMFGAMGGTLIGLWGAVIGVASARGKLKSFVLGSVATLLVLGALCLGAGLVALADSQPSAVYYPLLLLGGILVLVLGTLRGGVRSRYEQFELKQMQSLDV